MYYGIFIIRIYHTILTRWGAKGPRAPHLNTFSWLCEPLGEGKAPHLVRSMGKPKACVNGWESWDSWRYAELQLMYLGSRSRIWRCFTTPFVLSGFWDASRHGCRRKMAKTGWFLILEWFLPRHTASPHLFTQNLIPIYSPHLRDSIADIFVLNLLSYLRFTTPAQSEPAPAVKIVHFGKKITIHP